MVGIYRGVIIPGFVRWCKISSIHYELFARLINSALVETAERVIKRGRTGNQRISTGPALLQTHALQPFFEPSDVGEL